MSFLKNVWADLVERKLWPVAIGLVLALVAIPVVLGRSSGKSSGDAPLPVPAAAATNTAVVSLTTSKAKGAPLGAAHNPFRHLGGLVAATASGQTTPVVTPAATPGGAVSISGSASSGGPVGGGAPRPATPVTGPPSNGDIISPSAPPSAPSVPSVPSAPSSPSSPIAPATIAAGYRVDVTYGRTSTTRSMTDLARLSPLNAINSPIALFVGTKDDHNTAIFMILSDVAASGDGTCRPSPNNCEVVGLHPGDAELFDVPTKDGRVLRYTLEVKKISRKLVRSARAGITSRHRESKFGRQLLHDAISRQSGLYVAKYRYALAKGVVTKVMPSARAATVRSAAAGAVAVAP